MQQARSLVLRVSATRHPILILGESGVGKGLVAREIHAHSPWKDRSFVTVDCPALTPTLIETELFGHARGAFTGAGQSRDGLLAAAGGGTLFLDEIGELPVHLQPKLLHALEEREVKPVGSNQQVRLEARIIAATNEDLEAAMGRGTFRTDLYFRLNVLSMTLPPLREHKSDIPELVRYFLQCNAAEGAGGATVSGEAMHYLMSYDWPGNVRELFNWLRRALALGSGPRIQVGDLPPELARKVTSPPGLHGPPTLRDLERRTILDAVQAVAGDRIRAAKLLGIGKTTIYRKLKEYGLEHANSLPPCV
jgi:DNA-binding NtrC family response regulator